MKLDPRYLRVTEILYPFSGLTHVDEIVLENAAVRGTRVHAVCESIVSGEGAWDVDDSIAGYVKSFESWWSLGHNVVAMEQRFFDDSLMITGQCDLIVDSPQGLKIVDLKTSAKPSKTWPLQGAAYAHLARQAGYPITGIEFIQLLRSGDDAIIHAYRNEWELFQKTLDVFRYFFHTGAVDVRESESLDSR